MHNLALDSILFIDIETVPLVYRYADLDPVSKSLWDEKHTYQQDSSGQSFEEIYAKAGVQAEFAKVICVSIGVLKIDAENTQFYSKSIANSNEHILLSELAQLLNSRLKSYILCAHNGKEFDFPFLGRRMLINGITLPKCLQLAGKKPWEIPHLDSLELWKFGDRKNFTSLKLLAHLFGIPSPKEDISGKDVARVYWEDKDLDRIAKYCQRDVLTLAQLLLKWNGKPLIDSNNVHEL